MALFAQDLADYKRKLANAILMEVQNVAKHILRSLLMLQTLLPEHWLIKLPCGDVLCSPPLPGVGW